jgi:S-formylglutathione hydrolase FrmB
MSLASFNHRSYCPGMDMPVTVLLPEKRDSAPALTGGKRYPVLYLLHGHGDDNTAWIRKSGVEMLMRDRDIITVMPAGHRGFYTNARLGHRYFDYIPKELPVVMANSFHASTKAGERYIAGFSMGGYGALKIALRLPEAYAAAGMLSVATSPYKARRAIRDAGLRDITPDFIENADRIFGSEQEMEDSADDNVFRLITQVKPPERPRIYHACGRQDPLYGHNRELKSALETEKDAEYRYAEGDGGHDWRFWDGQLAPMLEYMRIS